MLIFIFILLSFFPASITSFIIAMESRNWKSLNGSSKCSCGVKIKPINLIPIFGAIIANFKCYSCKNRFSPKMAIAELIAATSLLVLFFISNGSFDINQIYTLNTLFIIISSAFLGVIVFEDLDTFTVSDIYAMLAIFPLAFVFKNSLIFSITIIGSIYIFKLIADSYIAFRTNDPEAEAMGGGDILIFGLLGLLTNELSHATTGFIIIPIIGLLLKFTFYKNINHIPFIPAIVSGSLLTGILYLS